MLRSGKEHLESLRDGRVVYIGNEKVDDVTTHPAFRNAAQTVGALYDMKADPALRAEMTYEEDGGRHSIYFLRARSREDLQRRMIGHLRIADFTYGLFGRSPDHVASFVTGMAMNLSALPAPNAHPDNVLSYYKHTRDNDLYVAYAVLPPQAARDPNFYLKQNLPVPTLRAVREEDDGVVISGMKMLATGAVFANDIWIGNVHPAGAGAEEGIDHLRHSVQCAGLAAVVAQADGDRRHLGVQFAVVLSLRRKRQHAAVRRGQGAVGEGLRPRRRHLGARDLHQDAEPLLRQSSVERALLVEDAPDRRALRPDRQCDRRRPGAGGQGDARPHRRPGSDDRRHGQRPDQCLREPGRAAEGYVCFNRRMMYGALDWCTQNYSRFIDDLRELCGGGVFQMPADISVMQDAELAKQFQTFWQTPQCDAVTRMKLFKLAWDMVGSEFAGRHQQYEKFYAGAPFIIRNHSYRETDWASFTAIVEKLMAGYDYQGAVPTNQTR